MSEVKKLLFITNAEFGQSSICVSIIRELLSRQDSIEIHLLSFPALQDRVTDLLDGENQRFKFHSLLSAPSFAQKHEEGGSIRTEAISHSAGFFASLRSYFSMGKVMLPWRGDEYMKLYHECCQFIKEIQPDLCICDGLFLQGQDAAESLKSKYILLSPVPWRGDQGIRVFSYPAISSGYKYPVPLLLKPLNYFLNFCVVLSFIFGPAWRDVESARKQSGILHPFPSLIAPKKVLTISASAPECDFPFDPNPELSLPVGPIVQPIQDLQEVDPELYNFISRKRTILLALGSHVLTTEK